MKHLFRISPKTFWKITAHGCCHITWTRKRTCDFQISWEKKLFTIDKNILYHPLRWRSWPVTAPSPCSSSCSSLFHKLVIETLKGNCEEVYALMANQLTSECFVCFGGQDCLVLVTVLGYSVQYLILVFSSGNWCWLASEARLTAGCCTSNRTEK